MSALKRISLWAGAAAVIAESGAKNMLVSTLLTVGTPAATTGFVYEVVQMRRDRLEREAEDRKTASTREKPPRFEETVADGAPAAVSMTDPDAEAAASLDLRHRLATMLIARDRFVDLYGGAPEAVPPVYQKVALDMLAEDERVFAKLDAEKRRNFETYAATFEADEARLRTLHAQVAMLGPAQVATNGAEPIQGASSATDFRK